MYQFIPLEECYVSLPDEGICIIEACSEKEQVQDGLSIIRYFVKINSEFIRETFLVHEMGDAGLGGEIANQKRQPHMQFTIQAAEFSYKNLKLYVLTNNKNIHFSLKLSITSKVLSDER